MRARRWALRGVLGAAVLGLPLLAPLPASAAPERVLDRLLPAEAVGPGVSHREFTTTKAAGKVIGDVVQVDLRAPGVRIDLLSAGKVASTAPVTAMADAAGAVAGINGDFFDISATGAATGPAVRSGKPIKAAVPQGRRAAPAVPGAEMDYVYAIGTDGVGRIDRLPLTGEVSSPHGTLPIVAYNQHAVPVGGVGLFTADWGRSRAQTLCGTDTDPQAGCADRWEIVVRNKVVTEVGSTGARALAADELALDGREQGATALRAFKVGEPVDIEYELTPASGVKPYAAVGGQPILVNGKPTERLDDRIRAPRSAAGNTADGHTVMLVTVDGRQTDSVGATLSELSALLAELGLDDAVNLDGGGSSTLVYREKGQPKVAIVSDPSGTSARRVPDGLGVFVK
ncbi:phosphodiester glycosidase family protein [Pseudonocardia sp. CA-107938]|uniref:phosphodiester glycosidase family protein n=1 Tax=Pseudonocardia sp. CA-107938 TaxID=3240021 RepID=UPI003D9113E8